MTDWLEAGFIGKYIERSNGVDDGGAGPFARVRLLKNDGIVPQVGVGAYGQWGDSAVSTYGLFSAAYWRLPIDEDGFFKSLGEHLGTRETWYGAGGDSLRLWWARVATAVADFPGG